MKNKTIVILFSILLFSQLLFFVLPVKATDWLSGWQYRKSNTINYASGAGTNYQIKYIIHYSSGTDNGNEMYCSSYCKTDFGDIRFTTVDGSTQLSYFLETKTDSDNATFWVKITSDLSTAPVTIYVYFGKNDATSNSNENDVFGATTTSLAYQKTYGKTTTPETAYPDTNDKEFTDNNNGTNEVDAFGFHKPATQFWLNISVDLTYSKIITKQETYSGYPWSNHYATHYVSIYGSNDNTTWIYLSSVGDLNAQKGTVGTQHFTLTSETTRIFHYIRFCMYRYIGDNGGGYDWLMLNEGYIIGKDRKYVNPEPSCGTWTALENGIKTITFYFTNGGILLINGSTVNNASTSQYTFTIFTLTLCGVPNNNYSFVSFNWTNGNTISNPYNYTASTDMTIWCNFTAIQTGYTIDDLSEYLILGGLVSFISVVLLAVMLNEKGEKEKSKI